VTLKVSPSKEYTLAADAQKTIDVLANDTDVDDDSANLSLDTVTIVDSDGNTLTDQGTVSIVNNKLVFVPGDDFDSLAVGETILTSRISPVKSIPNLRLPDELKLDVPIEPVCINWPSM
jgi:hypothetical protein